MRDDDNILHRLRAKGEELLSQASGEIGKSPQLVAALQAAVWSKEKLDDAVQRAMKAMNVPTRTELQAALDRIETLERQVSVRERKRAGRARNAAKLAAATRRMSAPPRAKRARGRTPAA